LYSTVSTHRPHREVEVGSENSNKSKHRDDGAASREGGFVRVPRATPHLSTSTWLASNPLRRTVLLMVHLQPSTRFEQRIRQGRYESFDGIGSSNWAAGRCLIPPIPHQSLALGRVLLGNWQGAQTPPPTHKLATITPLSGYHHLLYTENGGKDQSWSNK
jgi:hypothetical protein